MIARHVFAEFALQMLDQGRYPRGGVVAIERRCHHCMMLLRTVLPGHDFIRVGLAPPVRRIGPESREEERPLIRLEDLRAEAISRRPVRLHTRRRPGHVDREADKVHTHCSRHPDLCFERPGWAPQMHIGITRPIKRHGQVAHRFRPGPEGHAIMLASRDGQVRLMVNVPVGPLSGRRLAELDVQASGPAGADGGLNQHRAYGVGRSGRPRSPVARERLRPAFEVAYWRHLFARCRVHDLNVIEKYIAGNLAEAEVQGAGSGRIFLRDEFEFDGAASRLDSDGRRTRSAEEHSRAHRPAVYHQARRAGTGLDADCETLGRPGCSEEGKACEYPPGYEK